MNLPTCLIKPLSLFYKRELDSHRAAKIYAEYDEQRGYARYSDICKQALRRDITSPANDELLHTGVTWLNLIEPTTAGEVIEQIRANNEPSFIKKDTRNLTGFHIVDKDQIKSILNTIITPAADQQFLHYFQSEYLVHTITFALTPCAEEQASVSFRWHCDKGPRKHLKMIVYLNSSDEHGGNTEFINLDDTASVAAKGYLFGWSQNRTGDIQHLSKIAGKPIQGCMRPMAAGDAVIFQPALTLHRGISPRWGDRFAITLCLLPSPVSWQQALADDALTDMAVSEKWHKHADELLQRFGMPSIQ